MTAHAPIVPGDIDPWVAATRAVNAWRGEAIHHFTRAELSFSETRLLLAARSGAETNVRLRRLLGQRFDDLTAALVAVKGVKTAKASKALAEFRRFDAIRPILCHGADKIALDRHGQWVAVFKLVDLRAGEATRVSRAFEEREALDLLASLSKSAAELGSALQSLRDKLRPSALAK